MFSNLKRLIRKSLTWLFNYKKAVVNLLPYSADNLAVSLSNDYTPPRVIASKSHFIYLKGYLSHSDMNAQIIVIENNYVNKDFLHDYTNYYSLCFKNYHKFCKRVHFFSKSYTSEEIQNIIVDQENEHKDFWDAYLGFIVVKPIPVTVIGYTVLKTFIGGRDFASRNFWGLRPYKVHLFGNEVNFSSLAFQEQDSVLAACATTAIWVMLNKASINVDTVLKSPSQITKDADNVSFDGSRLFPNRKGLSIIQICRAIQNSGLVSEIKSDNFLLRDINGNPIDSIVTCKHIKKILSAYSPIGIPIILIIKVPSGIDYGYHAITVSGYKQKPPVDIPPGTEVSWLSPNIEKFYAHDDQWGPFVRIEFVNDIELHTPWTEYDIGKRPTYTTSIIVPLFPKIRIAYEDIEAIVLGLDTILTLFFNTKIVSDLIWDIKIDFSENYKLSIKQSSLDTKDKLKIMTDSLPKYMWIASCYIGQHKIMEFTFDATDVVSGMIGIDVISYLPDIIRIELKQHLEINRNLQARLFNHKQSQEYYQFFIDNL